MRLIFDLVNGVFPPSFMVEEERGRIEGYVLMFWILGIRRCATIVARLAGP
jgi:hypothetical protein